MSLRHNTRYDTRAPLIGLGTVPTWYMYQLHCICDGRASRSGEAPIATLGWELVGCVWGCLAEFKILYLFKPSPNPDPDPKPNPTSTQPNSVLISRSMLHLRPSKFPPVCPTASPAHPPTLIGPPHPTWHRTGRTRASLQGRQALQRLPKSHECPGARGIHLQFYA